MRLSEAIRAGTRIGPQAFGALETTEIKRERVGWFRHKLVRTKKVCALGGAFLAQGCKSHAGPAGSGKPFRGEQHGDTAEFIEQPSEWNVVLLPEFDCPQCEFHDQGYRVIAHLNDEHEWTREAIALWAERIEKATTRVAQPTPVYDEWPAELDV